MLIPMTPAWKRTGCLVWSPRTTETGFVPLLGTLEQDAILDSEPEGGN